MSLRLGVKVIFAYKQGECVLCRILHDPIYPSTHLELAPRQCKKETTSCTRFYVQDPQWIGSVFNSYPWDLLSLH
jgi:hypothetical protein